MAIATLDAPLPLSTLQATKVVVRTAHLEFAAGVVQIQFDLVDASGAVVDRRSITAQSPAVTTYVANQEATIYARLLAFLGVTGTVA